MTRKTHVSNARYTGLWILQEDLNNVIQGIVSKFDPPFLTHFLGIGMGHPIAVSENLLGIINQDLQVLSIKQTFLEES
jgi:hypothetical protein